MSGGLTITMRGGLDEKVELPAGQFAETVLDVQGTGTTGYLWRLEADPAEVEVMDNRLLDNDVGVGSLGIERFVFKVLVAKDCSIRLIAQRPWEDAPVSIWEVVLKADPSLHLGQRK